MVVMPDLGSTKNGCCARFSLDVIKSLKTFVSQHTWFAAIFMNERHDLAVMSALLQRDGGMQAAVL